ncbi:hypothetical protein EW146_g1421 [Bondarzewia mesenterica]|uniref:Glucose receptor Git3 N-terminal domain-containing protein n=1 Tax=Bondarzewia mesenterica TaxID=1095465 RepID=A0A4S4M3Z9_9AGAM|nr:hypothetical protein EW146_g1421 [Bondarzewia mesenterica]
MGNVGAAYFIIVMGVHTFTTLVMRNRHPNWLTAALMILGLIAMIAIGAGPSGISKPGLGPLYGASGAMCGMTRQWPVLHLVLQLLPMFTAALISSIVYSLVFLILRGTLVINGGLKLNLNPQQRWNIEGSFEGYQRFINSIARSMLWFPIVYVTFLVPSSIIQLMDASGSDVAFGTMSFAFILELLLGMCISSSCPAIGISQSPSRQSDVESFGTPEGRSSPAGKKPKKPLLLGGAQRFPPPKGTSDGSRRIPVKYDAALITSSSSSSDTMATASHQDMRHVRSDNSLNSTMRLITPLLNHGHAHTLSGASTIMSAASLQRAISPNIALSDDVLPLPPPVLLQKQLAVVPQLHELAPSLKPPGLTAPPRRVKPSVSHFLAEDSNTKRASLTQEMSTVESYQTDAQLQRASMLQDSPASQMLFPIPLTPAAKRLSNVQEAASASPSSSRDRGLSLISLYYSGFTDDLPPIPRKPRESFLTMSSSSSNGSSELPVVKSALEPKLKAAVSMSAVGVQSRPSGLAPTSVPKTPLTPEIPSPSWYGASEDSEYTSDSDAALSSPAPMPSRPSFTQSTPSRNSMDQEAHSRPENEPPKLDLTRLTANVFSRTRLSPILDVSPVSTTRANSNPTFDLPSPSSLSSSNSGPADLNRNPTVSHTLQSELRARTTSMTPDSQGGLSSLGFAALIAGAASANIAPMSMSARPERTPTTASRRRARESAVDTQAGSIPHVLYPATMTPTTARPASVERFAPPTPTTVPGLHARKSSASSSSSVSRAGSIAATDPYATMRQVQVTRPQYGRAMVPAGGWRPTRDGSNSGADGTRPYGYL